MCRCVNNGGLNMINSVAFKGLQSNSSLKDLYGAPQRFQRTTPYEPNAPEKKKSGAGKKIAIGAAIAVAAATALALITKKTEWLKYTEKMAEDANLWQKVLNGTKKGLNKAGTFIADKAGVVWNAAKNLFAKKPATTVVPDIEGALTGLA